ncbi:peptidoglycan/LPS O-acetylase OafA/YrhL [Bradyrhizobium sp. GM5.1]
MPTLPNGAWSITVEFHFYLLFPYLLALSNRFGPCALLIGICLSLCLRALLWVKYGEVQLVAYWTIVGAIDQFLMGMFFATAGLGVKARRILAFTCGLLFLVFWQIFDAKGGFFNLDWGLSVSLSIVDNNTVGAGRRLWQFRGVVRQLRNKRSSKG